MANVVWGEKLLTKRKWMIEKNNWKGGTSHWRHLFPVEGGISGYRISTFLSFRSFPKSLTWVDSHLNLSLWSKMNKKKQFQQQYKISGTTHPFRVRYISSSRNTSVDIGIFEINKNFHSKLGFLGGWQTVLTFTIYKWMSTFLCSITNNNNNSKMTTTTTTVDN